MSSGSLGTLRRLMDAPGGERSRRLIRPIGAGIALVALVVALAAVLDVGPFGGGGPTLTKAEFIAKGDAICKAAHDQFNQLQESPPSTAAEAAALTDKLIEISKSELSQIQGLHAPSEVQPALDRYLQAREQGIALLEKGLKAAEDKDARAYANAQAQIAAGQVKRLKLAHAVGFSECSEPVGTVTTGQ